MIHGIKKNIKNYNNLFQIGKFGGYSEVSVTDPKVLQAAETAFAFYKTMAPLLGDLSLQEVIKAEKQVVNGYNYKIKFRTEVEGLNNSFSVYCDAVVNNEPVHGTFKTLEVSCEPRPK